MWIVVDICSFNVVGYVLVGLLIRFGDSYFLVVGLRFSMVKVGIEC